jgi:hypothetical protein
MKEGSAVLGGFLLLAAAVATAHAVECWLVLRVPTQQLPNTTCVFQA